ncbi:RagB/SusD family nutrient uptake outer membrane protein [Chitinophaga ginsengisoli]|uniref:SusD-like starch-binding protein associating with outer membrane n=1 Tax=Chitinophaga ginsengisoli TaxID=363837 RepID=A0A2P8FXF4_9BACT|nr:RagB/SusD family nutrient uptake outer membrane protein [Chitinophaga ginsengisoli]PSL26406.1 SusD-like starch-binding protein associating with outer membrane [Chitinophaga ginsengisoli]
MSIINRLIYFSLGSVLLCWSTGCRDYVEVTPIGKRALVNTSDYQQLLYNANDFQPSASFPAYTSDDYGISDTNFETNMNKILGAAYSWAVTFVGDGDDQDWERFYKQIYVCNQIIEGVPGSAGGTAVQKDLIRAEAQVHRAYAYLILVNSYAKHYNKTTAATDPGVPVLLRPDLYATLNRASVQAVYEQVIADLEAAIPALPDHAIINMVPSATAAYGLLARASLYMADYTNAARYADSALTRQSTLLDLRKYVDNVATLPLLYQDPEVMLAKEVRGMTQVYALNPALVQLFTTGDLRYTIFTADGSNYGWAPFNGRGFWRPMLTNTGAWTGPGVAEMMLIKAECEARSGKTADALSLLNALRVKRFTAEAYADLTAATPEDALRLVLNERRRELMGTGLRWFDQKRLNLEPAFAITVTRTYMGKTYTLEPNSNRYVFPIATTYIQFNPEISQNPR